MKQFILYSLLLLSLVLARPAAGDFDFDRRWTAFRQMFDALLAAKGRSAPISG